MLFQFGRGGRQLQEDEAAAAKDCSCPRGEHQILPGMLLIIIWRALGCKLRITMIWLKKAIQNVHFPQYMKIK